jgi:hypothetical protein
MSQEHRFVLWFHAGFALLAGLALALPVAPLGMRILALVVLYNIAFPILTRHSAYAQTRKLWEYLLPLSILMTLPDWFLSDVLRVLIFPETGSPFIGTVPLFMAGMWVIPLFIIVYCGQQTEERYGRPTALFAVAAISLVMFGGAEATLWAVPIWYAQNVTQVAHVALYVLVPEIALGVTAYLAYMQTRHAFRSLQLLSAWVVMCLYLGHLCLFYLLIE